MRYLVLGLVVLALLFGVYFVRSTDNSHRTDSDVVTSTEPDTESLSPGLLEAAAAEKVFTRDHLSSDGKNHSLEAGSTQDSGLKILVQSRNGVSLTNIPITVWSVYRDQYSIVDVQSTGPNGRTTFRFPPMKSGDKDTLAVGFAFPCGDMKPVEFLRSELPTKVIVLRLEPTGTIAVQLLGADGHPWTTPMDVHLAAAPEDAELEKSPFRNQGPGSGIGLCDGQGQVDFFCFGNQNEYVVGAQYSRYGEWELKTISGPALGHTVHVEIRLLEPRPLAHFKILNPDNSPWRLKPWKTMLRNIHLNKTASAYRMSGFGGYTDTNGVASFAIRPEMTDGEWTTRWMDITIAPHSDDTVLRAKLDLTDINLVPGIDLGEAQLIATSKLAVGHVVSTAGTVIDAFTISISEEVVISNTSRTASQWERLPTTLSIDEKGEFQIHGSNPSKRLQLVVKAPGFHKKELIIDTGDSDLIIEMERSPIIEGRITGLSAKQLRSVDVLFAPEGELWNGFASGTLTQVHPQADGHFFMSSLSGTSAGTLTVQIRGSLTLLAHFQEVTPWFVDSPSDARLNSIHLGTIYDYQVKLVDSHNKKIGNGIKFHVLSDSPLPIVWGFEVWGHTFRASDLRSKLHIGFYHPKYRYLQAVVSPGETTLQFEPALTTQVDILNHLVLPEDTELKIEITTDIAGGLVNQKLKLPAEIPSTLSNLGIPEAGTYSLWLTLKDKKRNRTEAVLWPGGAPSFQYIVLDAPDQVFQFSFPNVEIQEAAERLRQQD